MNKLFILISLNNDLKKNYVRSKIVLIFSYCRAVSSSGGPFENFCVHQNRQIWI